MTGLWKPSGECEACGNALPPQLYAGGPPRRWGCEACRVWAGRHPGEDRECARCDRPADTRHPQTVWLAQRVYRGLVMEARWRETQLQGGSD